MRIAHAIRKTMTSMAHAGETFEADAHGAFDVPEEVANWLMERFPHLWHEAEPAPAEQIETPAPADEQPGKGKTGRGAKASPAPAPEVPTQVELTPADQPPAE